jgi:hypothetical protein
MCQQILDCSRPSPTKEGLRGVAQLGSAPALGAGGRWFESSRPDFLWVVSKMSEWSGLKIRWL